MLVILATRDAKIRRLQFEASAGKYFMGPCLKNTQHKAGLVEWLK
jgi:hypothetical protein